VKIEQMAENTFDKKRKHRISITRKYKSSGQFKNQKTKQ